MRHLKLLLLLALPLAVVSCASSSKVAQGSKAPTKAEILFQKASKLEKKGSWKAAAKKYEDVVEQYPTSKVASTAAYRVGQNWEKANKPQNAFDAYQTYITLFRNGAKYSEALDSQSDIAFKAAKGGLNKRFLGLKSELTYAQVTGLLNNVISNAPASDLAARAQFEIGAYAEKQERTGESVAAFFKLVDSYPNHKLAPEATYRAGLALSGYSQEHSENSSNLYKAKSTLEDLIQQYPSSSQASKARKLLKEIVKLDNERTFEVATFYEKKGKYDSAKYYYQELIDRTKSSDQLHQQAQKRLKNLP